MIIHCTKKLAARLPEVSGQALHESSPIGSWHGKLLHVDRRQCLFLCHDESRSVLFLPGVRKAQLVGLDLILPELLSETLQSLGCSNVSLARLKLAMGPVQFDIATDRSGLASMNIVARDLEAHFYRVPNVLDLDPVAISAQLSSRPATINKRWVRPNELLVQRVESVAI